MPGGIGWASAEEIDQINILQATFLAMKRAVEQLSVPPAWVLVDGNQMPPLAIPGETVVKGDAQCASIAAASAFGQGQPGQTAEGVGLSLSPNTASPSTRAMVQRLTIRLFKPMGCCPFIGKAFLKSLGEKG